MSVAYYFDHNVSRQVAAGLRRFNIDLLTAQDDGSNRLPDDDLLARATALGRVLVTHDDDFLSIASRWLHEGRSHAGLLYVHQRRLSTGDLIRNLQAAHLRYAANGLADVTIFLPLPQA